MKAFSAIILIFSLATFVLGQQITITNAAGQTIIEQITTNAFGQTLTQTLGTLAPGGATSAATSPAASSASSASSAASAAAATTPATTATTTQDQQGPVGQPGPTPLTPGGPTPYTYTTTDASGNPLTVTATFIPTFPATTPHTPTGSGTVLDYSAWLSMLTASSTGTQPVASQGTNRNPASRAASISLSLLLGALSIAIVGVVGRSNAIPL